ncbi:MAG: FapA family protein, partial [Candidatus Muirbacterium halophilum]|nr:FapA family protein [Candidatus Muirbacterium halophilum]
MDKAIKILLKEGLNLVDKTKELSIPQDSDNINSEESLKDITEFLISENGSFDIDISSDKLKVFLTVYPPVGKGSPVTVEKVKKYLEKIQVNYGIDWQIINNYVSNAIKKNKIIRKKLIAKGIPAFDGKAETYILHFEKKYNNEKITDNEKIDYRDINKVKSVESGEKIISIIPGEPSKEGIDVTGNKIIPAVLKEEKLFPGLNTKFVENENAVYSEIEGRVHIGENNQVSVYPELVIQGDFDLEIGNINFDGSLIIHGNINDGFDINVRGDIHVDGNIYSSNVYSNGNITVIKGILTKEKCIVKADKNISAKFIENSFVSAGNDVYISKAAIRSTIIAGNKVIASGEKGQLVASLVYGFNGIECVEAGSPMGTTTRLIAGLNYYSQIEYNEKVLKLEELREMNVKISAYLQKILGNYCDPCSMENEVKKILCVLSNKNKIILSEIEKIKNKL